MELVIHQIGDFGWFSERKTAGSSYPNVLSALKAHIEYVEKKAQLVFGSVADIFAKAKEELSKRWDSRIALKFWIAVPKDWNSQEAIERVVAFVSKELDVPEKHITAFFHAHKNNPHIHIVLYPRDGKGRKLNITKAKLKEFHRAWDRYLESLGYRIKRYKNFKYGKHLANYIWVKGLSLNLPNWLLYRDEELKELYEEFIKLRDSVIKEVVSYAEEKANELFREISDEEIDEAFREENKPLKRLLGIFKKDEQKFKEKQKEEIALQLKALGFSDDDKIAVVLIGEGKKPLQRIVLAKKLLEERFLAFLRAKNSEGYNIYITLNKLKPTARSRKSSDFEEKQNKIYLDIDGEKLGVEGIKLLGKIVKEHNLPKPTLVIRTSKNNVQAIWVLDSNENYEQLEFIMREISEQYGLDHTQDIARVFRLAGFYNRKEGKNNLVYITKASSFKKVSFDSFKKFLKAVEIEEKRKEIRNAIKQQLKLKSFEYSSFLDKYKKAIQQVVRNSNVLKRYEEKLLAEFDKLAKQVINNERVFKSASEFELALVHSFRRALESDFAPTELRKLLTEIFEQVLEKVRPQKLERNKKYVRLTVDKALRFYDDGLLEGLAGEFNALVEKLGAKFVAEAWRKLYPTLKISNTLDLAYYYFVHDIEIDRVFGLAEELKEKAILKAEAEKFRNELREKRNELLEKALREFAKEWKLSEKEVQKLRDLILSKSISGYKLKAEVEDEAIESYKHTKNKEKALKVYVQMAKDIVIAETYLDYKDEIAKAIMQEYKKELIRNYKKPKYKNEPKKGFRRKR